MIRTKRGDYGYIKAKKIWQFTMMLLMAAIGFLIYGAGYAVNDWKPSKVCLMLAILMVLPGAKFFVGLAVVFPYKSPDRKDYEHWRAKTEPLGGRFWSDLVITSTEKVMNLDFLYVGNESVIALVGKEGQNVGYIQTYLSKGVRNRADRYTIKVCSSKKEFGRMLEGVRQRDTDMAQEEEVVSYLASLIV